VAGEATAAVLVVDDRPEQRLSLSAVLGEIGVEVVEAASGRDALRWLLKREFALILLDVNMPDMDGFETAELIRQRQSSKHTPIIFVTAYGDEERAARGYSLGAVDYIMAPVDPAILRAKVGVFLELFRKTDQVSRHAESLQRHAKQLRRLAEAAIAIHAATSLEELLKTAADAAGSIVGAQQVAVQVDAPAGKVGDPLRSGEARCSVRRPEHTALVSLGRSALSQGMHRPIRLLREELARHPRFGELARDGELPLHGWLAAPLSSRDGMPLGWIQLSEKRGGDFDPEDEIILVQLAQMVSIAAENTLLNQAQEANRLKDQFLATLSHELRTPLQAILTWSRVLRDAPNDRNTQARGLEVIERSARSQTRLIEDLLDVSRIISGKLVLEMAPTPLRQVVDAAVEDARPAALEKEITIVVDHSGDPAIDGDATRLRQVMGNLFSNAIKFTPAGGRVEVVVSSDGSVATIAMTDTGRGIDPAFLPQLFERFRQADSSTTRHHGGLGIGLSVVRSLVELHGGSVSAESEGDGKGATFSVRLPLGSGTVDTQERAEPPAPPPRMRATLSGVRVLIVEDDADTRECLVLALEEQGAVVTSARSAAEAIERLDESVPDALISDLGMPGEDGFSLIRRVRERPGDGRIPALALSAYVRPEERTRALLAGFDLHIGKPVEPSDLAAAVRSLVSRAR
jgi:signal transduction histidine kinase/DNA-binding response OmpR family regulator